MTRKVHVDYIEIRQALSRYRVHKFGAIPPSTPEGKELWLTQMDAAAAALGLPNVYRTHPFKGRFTDGSQDA